MKNIIVIVIAFSALITNKVLAQEIGDKEKMKVFAGWIGRWQGEGSIQMGPGEPKKSTVDEHIEYKLDGMVVLIEGVGKAMDAATNKETIVHHALGLLSYDKGTSQYKFKSYLKDGRAINPWFNALGENSFEWGFDMPQGKIRYTITID